MKYILFAFGLYLLYQFIFRLVLPIYLASRNIKKGFREMHERMQQQQQQNSSQAQPNSGSQKDAPSKGDLGEYIEFEEVTEK